MTSDQIRTGLVRTLLACVLLAGCTKTKTGAISPEARMRVALAAEQSGDANLARSMYVSAAAEAWGDRAVQIAAAQGLARAGAPADAMALLDQLLQKSPSDKEARRLLGSLQAVNDRAPQAVDNLTKVLASSPDDDTARIDLAVAMDMMGRHAEAQPLYRAILARAPGDQDAANNLALSLLLSGQPDAARAVVAPFRGRADLSERMRATMDKVDPPPPATRQPGGR